MSIQKKHTVKNAFAHSLLTFLNLLGFHALTTAAEVVTPESWVEVLVRSDPLLQNLDIPADAAARGMWSDVFDWPMNGLHSIVLSDGRVLTFGTDQSGNQQNGRTFDLWDPFLGTGPDAHLTNVDPNRVDSFCSAAVYLTDGALMISGGNGDGKNTTLYDGATHTSMTAPVTLAEARWYPTLLMLPDGRPLFLGGMVPYTEGMQNNPEQAIANGWPSMTPEIFESGQWRSLFGAYSRLAFGPDYLRTSYPRAWVAPNGLVFGISADQMWYLDPDADGGLGKVISQGSFKQPFSFNNPVNVGATNTAVMFAPGKILQVGGNGGFNGDELPASNMATVIDINSGAPKLIEQSPMSFPRRYPNGIVLANGDVVITGGATYGNSLPGQPGEAVYAVEIWSPDTGIWTTGAAAGVYRGYHSITSLLPNGAILSTGGGTPGPVTNLNGEIYYPPYLFQNTGTGSELAPRPRIAAISSLSFEHEALLQLDMVSSDPVDALVLLAASSGTHSFNAGQRLVPLIFSQKQFRLTATLPNNRLAPPGYYQVVAVNANGTPSYGVMVGIGQSQAAAPVTAMPYDPPSLDDFINTPVISVGESVNYAVNESSGTTYSWNLGDGTVTPFSANSEVTHSYKAPGAYVVILTAESQEGIQSTRTFVQAVSTSRTSNDAHSSAQIVIDDMRRIWTVNPDNDSVSVISDNHNLIAEIPVGISPRSLAIAPDNRIWVTNKKSASISIIDQGSLSVINTISLPVASQPHGLVFSPVANEAFVVLEATGELLKLNALNGSQIGAAVIGNNPRELAIEADGGNIFVSRFVTPPLPGESSGIVSTAGQGGEVLAVDANSMTLINTMRLQYSNKAETEISGPGVPNYLGAPVISPDGAHAWIPSKQDNLSRGTLRSGQNLNFQNSVRAIASRIDLGSFSEDFASRVDMDNAGLASAAAFHPNGVYLFVALETSREVALLNAINGSELLRIQVGLAPQGLAVSEDGLTLYVKNFMARSVSVINLGSLINNGQLLATQSAVIGTVQNEKLNATVKRGKELFHDAKDTRLATDAYLSCATCHNDGGQDGRVWDLTGFGEGLRNTIALNGRAGTGHGLLHWSANFNEVHDFEKQIRALSGGTGLMQEADYNSGTRNQPLGDSKAGFSADLDALAAYLVSLNQFEPSPYRNTDGSLTAAASAGETVFNNACASCHGGSNFTISSDAASMRDIGTLTTASGQRLGAAFTAVDVPTLRDAWATAPYLHNGSAATLAQAIAAHNNVSLSEMELNNLVAYVQQIGDGEFTGGNDEVIEINEIHQAEDHTWIYATVDSDHSGFNGRGFVNTANRAGSWVQFTVELPVNGVYTLSMRHANGASTRPADVQVNGLTQISSLNLNSTGAWKNWSEQGFTLDLKKGINQILFVATNSAGLPNVDQLSISGPVTEVNITYQAEDHTWMNATVDSDHSGFNGRGFVNTANRAGSWVQFTVELPVNGVYTLSLRHANGASTRPADVQVNGLTQISPLNLNSTGAWKNWSEQGFTLDLKKGINQIRLVATDSAGLPNVDQLNISSPLF